MSICHVDIGLYIRHAGGGGGGGGGGGSRQAGVSWGEGAQRHITFPLNSTKIFYTFLH